MKCFVIDVNRDGTVVNQMNVEEGKYRRLVNVQGGTFIEQAGIVAVHILKHRPTKVFVDDIGIGAGFLDGLRSELSEMGLKLQDDATVI